MDQSSREQEVLSAAENLYAQNPNWVQFFREVLGVSGVARRVFPIPEEMARFERTPEYKRIQQMLNSLRDRPLADEAEGKEKEPTRVITVRLPASIHESLQTEAHDHKTSMNRLCITKLMRMIDAELLPSKDGGAEKEAASTSMSDEMPMEEMSASSAMSSHDYVGGDQS